MVEGLGFRVYQATSVLWEDTIPLWLSQRGSDTWLPGWLSDWRNRLMVEGLGFKVYQATSVLWEDTIPLWLSQCGSDTWLPGLVVRLAQSPYG